MLQVLKDGGITECITFSGIEADLGIIRTGEGYMVVFVLFFYIEPCEIMFSRENAAACESIKSEVSVPARNINPRTGFPVFAPLHRDPVRSILRTDPCKCRKALGAYILKTDQTNTNNGFSLVHFWFEWGRDDLFLHCCELLCDFNDLCCGDLPDVLC